MGGGQGRLGGGHKDKKLEEAGWPNGSSHAIAVNEKALERTSMPTDNMQTEMMASLGSSAPHGSF